MKTPILLLALSAIVALTYANAIEGGFIWDDYALIQNQDSVKNLKPLSFYLSTPFWPRSPETTEVMSYYRPLTVFSYALDYRIYGDNASGFHLTNVLFHVLNCVLLFLLMKKIGIGPITAFVASMIWGVIPRLTETVTWISGRTDLLAGTCVFTGLLLLPWLTSTENDRLSAKSAGGLFAGAFFLFTGLLFKETAISGIVSAFLLFLIGYYRSERNHKTRHLLAALLMLVVIVMYFGVRHAVFGGMNLPAPLPLTLLQKIITFFEASGWYAVMILNPFTPNACIGLLGSPSLPVVALGALLIPVILIAIVRFRKTLFSQPQVLGFLLFACSIGMVLRITPIHLVTVAADRFLYIPLAGIAVLGAALVGRITKTAVLKSIRIAAFIILPCLMFMTYVRNGDWNNELRFWVKTAESAQKSNHFPKSAISNILYKNAHIQDALNLSLDILNSFDNSIMNNDLTNVSVKSNIAGFYLMFGKTAEARPLAMELIAKYPHVPQALYLHGVYSLHVSDFKTAEDDFRKALRIMPEFDNSSKMLEAAKKAEKDRVAIESLESRGGLTVSENTRLARYYASLGIYNKAGKYWDAVLHDKGSSEDELFSAVSFFLANGSIDTVRDAISVYKSRYPQKTLVRGMELDLEEREAFEVNYEKYKARIAALGRARP